MKDDENRHETHHAHKVQKRNKALVWQIATGALAIILIISIFTAGFGLNSSKSSGKLSADEVSKKSTEYINKYLLQGQGTVTVDSIRESNGMYVMELNVNGQKVDSYATKDGQLLFPQAIDLTQAPKQQEAPEQEAVTPANIQKSDKPKVELFVMSHCPYGTQMEKGIIPAINALGNKVDFEVKFVNYAMHPSQGEVEEQLNQYCIQKEFKSKYLTYLSKFLEAGNAADALKAAGLSQAEIAKCVEETDTQYDVTKNLEDKSSWISGKFPKFMIHDADNRKYGVQGSPTLVINEAQAQSGRDAKSLLGAICNAFNTKPSECNTDMSSYGTPAPGFGFGTQGGSATAAGCGV